MSQVKGKKILVVEDEPVIAAVVERVLSGMDAEVDIAANGKIAQGMLERKQYDLFLVDIRTPTMNGKELYEWMKQRHPQITGRVVFTTGDLITGDIETFLKQSGCLYLPKPFSPDELKNIVNKAFEEEQDA